MSTVYKSLVFRKAAVFYAIIDLEAFDLGVCVIYVCIECGCVFECITNGDLQSESSLRIQRNGCHNYSSQFRD